MMIPLLIIVMLDDNNDAGDNYEDDHKGIDDDTSDTDCVGDIGLMLMRIIVMWTKNSK